MPLPLAEELTPPEAPCRPLDADEEDWLEEAEELVELDAVDPVVEVAALPGIVAAPTTPNTAVAATAAAPNQKVSRFRSCRAASRASTRVVSIGAIVWNAAGAEMGTT